MTERSKLQAYGVVADLIGEELAGYGVVERASAKAHELEKIQEAFANAAVQRPLEQPIKNGAHT